VTVARSVGRTGGYPSALRFIGHTQIHGDAGGALLRLTAVGPYVSVVCGHQGYTENAISCANLCARPVFGRLRALSARLTGRSAEHSD
jgi:hypothetical protein